MKSCKLINRVRAAAENRAGPAPDVCLFHISVTTPVCKYDAIKMKIQIQHMTNDWRKHVTHE